MSGLSFAGMVVVAGQALKLLEANGVEVSGGHIVGQSVMFTLHVDAYDLLAARGELVEIQLSRAPLTDEISFHSTIINEARLAQLPDVRVMSIKRLPLRTVVPPLAAIGAPPEPAPAYEQGLVEAWGPFDADKQVSADPDTWPVPFGS